MLSSNGVCYDRLSRARNLKLLWSHEYNKFSDFLTFCSHLANFTVIFTFPCEPATLLENWCLQTMQIETNNILFESFKRPIPWSGKYYRLNFFTRMKYVSVSNFSLS